MIRFPVVHYDHDHHLDVYLKMSCSSRGALSLFPYFRCTVSEKSGCDPWVLWLWQMGSKRSSELYNQKLEALSTGLKHPEVVDSTALHIASSIERGTLVPYKVSTAQGVKQLTTYLYAYFTCPKISGLYLTERDAILLGR